MDILGLSTSPSSGGAYALILNEVGGNRRLPIIIGTFEAQAIALELENIKPPRPMTHDLLRNVFQSFNTFVKNIFINDLREGTFFAEIRYDYEGQEIQQDARPSDAIALAIRFNAPIFVESSILEEAGIIADNKEVLDEEGKKVDPSPVIKDEPKTSEKSALEILQSDLNKAIVEEDYERAAKIRDEISKLKE